MRVGDGGGFQRGLGEAGLLSSPMPEPGVGEKPGPALGVVDDRDFEEPVSLDLAVEELLGEEGKIDNVVDDGLGYAPAGVADDGSLAELEPENDRRVNPVIEAGDDDHLRGGRAQRHGNIA